MEDDASRSHGRTWVGGTDEGGHADDETVNHAHDHAHDHARDHARDDAPTHVDVLVVGAGLAGVGAAWHLQTHCPWLTWAIVEGRDAVGGTWDLFRYPGVRSDSDMHTLGYGFAPWTEGRAIADGPSIRAYVERVAREHGILPRIRFGHRVVRAAWESERARWTVELEVGPTRARRVLTCGFLYACTGYYDYARGHAPEWPRMGDFTGRLVHPQHWPADLDHAGHRVVVIGSGATAVTLVPALLEEPGAAAHVTMLQRSPVYVAELPSHDPIATLLGRVLPRRVAYAATRWKNVLRQHVVYRLARRHPAAVRRLLLGRVRRALGPGVPLAPHFTPRCAPWDERLCVVPDGDLFRVLRSGRAEVVTDEIVGFTTGGIELRSGRELAADVVVTATGLSLRLLGGMQVVVDGVPVEPAATMAYRGMMLSDVPNLATAIGYTNASWTLRCDLVAEHVCRLLAHMRQHGFVQVTARRDPAVRALPLLDLASGYVRRALATLPAQGDRGPWRMHQHYLHDRRALRRDRVDDPALEFRRAAAAEAPPPASQPRRAPDDSPGTAAAVAAPPGAAVLRGAAVEVAGTAGATAGVGRG